MWYKFAYSISHDFAPVEEYAVISAPSPYLVSISSFNSPNVPGQKGALTVEGR